VHGFDYFGSDLNWPEKLTGSAKDCQADCFEESKCDVWTWDNNRDYCFLKYKEAVNNKRKRSKHISGPKNCPGMFKILLLKHYCRQLS
jgi:hypothetical protein